MSGSETSSGVGTEQEGQRGLDARRGFAGLRVRGVSLFPSVDIADIESERLEIYERTGLVTEPIVESGVVATFLGTWKSDTTGSIWAAAGDFYNHKLIYNRDGSDPDSVLSDEERESGYFNNANSIDEVNYLRQRRIDDLDNRRKAGNIFSLNIGNIAGGLAASALDPINFALTGVAFSIIRSVFKFSNPYLFAATIGVQYGAPFAYRLASSLAAKGGLSVGAKTGIQRGLGVLFTLPENALKRMALKNAPRRKRLIARATEAAASGFLAEGAGALIRKSVRSDLDWMDTIIDTAVGTAIGPIFSLPGSLIKGSRVDAGTSLRSKNGVEINDTPDGNVELQAFIGSVPDGASSNSYPSRYQGVSRQEITLGYTSGRMQVDTAGRTAFYRENEDTLVESVGFDRENMRPLSSPLKNPDMQRAIERRINNVSNFVTTPINSTNRGQKRHINASFNVATREFREEVDLEFTRLSAGRDADLSQRLPSLPDEVRTRVTEAANINDDALLTNARVNIANRWLGRNNTGGDLALDNQQLYKQLSGIASDGNFVVTKVDVSNPILGITMVNAPFNAGIMRVVNMRHYVALSHSGRLNDTDINKLIVIGQVNKGRSGADIDALRFDDVVSLNNHLRKSIFVAPFRYTSVGFRDGERIEGLPGSTDIGTDRTGQLLVLTGDNGVQYGVFPQLYRFPSEFNKSNENFLTPVGGMTVKLTTSRLEGNLYVNIEGNYSRNDKSQIIRSGELGYPEHSTKISLFNNPVNGVRDHEIDFKISSIDYAGSNIWANGLERRIDKRFVQVYDKQVAADRRIHDTSNDFINKYDNRVSENDIARKLEYQEAQNVARLLNNEDPVSSVNVLVNMMIRASVREGNELSNQQVRELLSDDARASVPRIFRLLVLNGVDIRNFTVEQFRIVDYFKEQGRTPEELYEKIRLLSNFSSRSKDDITTGNSLQNLYVYGYNKLKNIGLGVGLNVRNNTEVESLFNTITNTHAVMSVKAKAKMEAATGSDDIISLQSLVKNLTVGIQKELNLKYLNVKPVGNENVSLFNIKLDRAVDDDSVLAELRESGNEGAVEYVLGIRDGLKAIMVHMPETNVPFDRRVFRVSALSNAILDRDEIRQNMFSFYKQIAVREKEPNGTAFAEKHINQVIEGSNTRYLSEYQRHLKDNSPDLYYSIFSRQAPHEFLSEETTRYLSVSLMNSLTGAKSRAEFINDMRYILDRYGVSDERQQTRIVSSFLPLVGETSLSSLEKTLNATSWRPAIDIATSLTTLKLAYGGALDVPFLLRTLWQNKIFVPFLARTFVDLANRVGRFMSPRNIEDLIIATGVDIANAGHFLLNPPRAREGSVVVTRASRRFFPNDINLGISSLASSLGIPVKARAPDPTGETLYTYQMLRHMVTTLLSTTDNPNTFDSVLQSYNGTGIALNRGSVVGEDAVGSSFNANESVRENIASGTGSVSNLVRTYTSTASGTTTVNRLMRTAVRSVVAKSILVTRNSIEGILQSRGLPHTNSDIRRFINNPADSQEFINNMNGTTLGVNLNDTGLSLVRTLDVLEELEGLKGSRIVDFADMLNVSVTDRELSSETKRTLGLAVAKLELLYTTNVTNGDWPAFIRANPLLRKTFTQFISYAFSAANRRFVKLVGDPRIFNNLFWIQIGSGVSRAITLLKINEEEDEAKRNRSYKRYNESNPIFTGLRDYATVADLGMLGLLASEVSRISLKPTHFGSNIPFVAPVLGTLNDAFGIFAGAGTNAAGRGYRETIIHNATSVANRYLYHTTALSLSLSTYRDAMNALSEGWQYVE